MLAGMLIAFGPSQSLIVLITMLVIFFFLNMLSVRSRPSKDRRTSTFKFLTKLVILLSYVLVMIAKYWEEKYKSQNQSSEMIEEKLK